MTEENPGGARIDDPHAVELADWLIRAGLGDEPREAMLETYCRKLVGMGVPLMRFHVTQRALHPVYGALGFEWRSSEGPERREYEHRADIPEDWLNSPFYQMLSTGVYELRERMILQNVPSKFPLINEMRERGATDYLARAMLLERAEEGRVYDPEESPNGALMSWISDGPDGFSERDIGLIEKTFPTLCIVLKSGALRQTTDDLLGIYLGKDAGRRVLSGKIQRGSSQWIDAVICYFDLSGFTSMSQKIDGEALIAMLNDYFGVMVERVADRGGEVLKFMGDGMLAIFDREKLSDAPERAISVVRALENEMVERSRSREADGLPTLGHTVALHAGRVLYGNIGADERLDFTVIGPEVNLAARISGMHHALGQRIIISDKVARDIDTDKADLVSLGRYMMRGVEHPQELFTIYEGTD